MNGNIGSNYLAENTMKQVTAFEAFDGSLHHTEEACRRHNMKDLPSTLSNLTRDQVQSAIDGTDHALGDAIEAAAAKCRAKRLERGDLRKRRKDQPETTQAPPPPPAVEDRQAA